MNNFQKTKERNVSQLNYYTANIMFKKKKKQKHYKKDYYPPINITTKLQTF